jgi:hypothetical protein
MHGSINNAGAQGDSAIGLSSLPFLVFLTQVSQPSLAPNLKIVSSVVIKSSDVQSAVRKTDGF